MGFRSTTHAASHDQRAVAAEPWFRVHPTVAIWVAMTLFVAVLVLRLSVEGKEDPITELFCLPVALLATAFGLRAGLAAGLGAVGLIGVWVGVADVDMTPLGWATRVIPLLLLGGLAGFATERIRAAQARERRSAAVAALQREAAEVNDSVVQRLAVAKWLLESDDVERGLAAVTATMVTAQALVSQMLGADSPLPGDLRRSRAVAT